MGFGFSTTQSCPAIVNCTHKLMIVSYRFLKRRLPAFLAFAGDFLVAMLLLRQLPFLIQAGQLESIQKLFSSFPSFLVLPGGMVLLLSFFGSYRTDIANLGQLSFKRPVVALLTLTIGILIGLSYQTIAVFTPGDVSRLLMALAIYLFVIGLVRIAIHLFYTTLLKKGWIEHRVLMAFLHSPQTPYLKEFLRHIRLNNLQLSGYCGPANHSTGLPGNTPWLGKFQDIPRVVKEQAIDEIIILNHSKNHRQTEKILSEIESEQTLVRMVPGTIETFSGQIAYQNLAGMPLISIKPTKRPIWYCFVKRIFDILIALAGLTITLLLAPIFSYLIRKSSPGPILFKQTRLGRNGKPFVLLKFRTMFTDAEKNGPQLADKEDDPRITPFGRFLRKNHLDELPQFWNILMGDMSLVGPRPERAYYARQLEKEAPYYRYVKKVKPGLTSLGMVKYGYAHNLQEMTERLVFDILYINKPSLILDFQIILHTFIYLVKKVFYRED